jgi:hypothetical protein
MNNAFLTLTGDAAYSSEPVPVLCDQQNISTKQSACKNIYFTLRPYFIQNICPSYNQFPPPPAQTTNSAPGGRPTVSESLI